MKKTIGATFAVAALALAACGSDGGGSAGGVQGEAADAAMALAEGEDFEIDEACVNDLASQLSDADAQALVDSGGDDAVLSPEGQATTLQIPSCIDSEALIDLVIAGMAQDGQPFDEACVRENLQDFDLSEIVASGEPTSEMIGALIACFDIGG
jgi:hypothetical protein